MLKRKPPGPPVGWEVTRADASTMDHVSNDDNARFSVPALGRRPLPRHAARLCGDLRTPPWQVQADCLSGAGSGAQPRAWTYRGRQESYRAHWGGCRLRPGRSNICQWRLAGWPVAEDLARGKPLQTSGNWRLSPV